MLFRHALALLLMIVSPLIVIGWLGSAAVRRQHASTQQQLRSILTERLVEIDRGIREQTERYERNLGAALVSADQQITSLRDLRRSQPAVREALLVDRDGRLIYPQRPIQNDDARLAWYGALSELARRRPIDSGDPESDLVTSRSSSSESYSLQSILTMKSNSSDSRSTNRKSIQTAEQPPKARRLRWQSWYHDNGLQLVLWLPRSDRSATGLVLERGRWMADLISMLPNSKGTEEEPDNTSSRVPAASVSADESLISVARGHYSLRDREQNVIYRWGFADDELEPSKTLATIPLTSPLAAWQLAYVGPPLVSSSWVVGSTLPLIASLVAVALTLMLLGTYVLTAMRRQMHLAQQRVSFASHVSHELKTPLTNIRLYAELARRDLSDENSDVSKLDDRIQVIEEESQRLSRLVSGVLDMVSSTHGGSRPKYRVTAPDEVIQHVLESFSPAFARLEFSIQTELRASQPVPVDSDLLELILVNLFSNVEKYSADGKHLTVTSKQSDTQTTIDVIDRGPGIRRSAAKRVFQPFTRLNDAVDAPAGTGLGLAIALNAARRHGGNLQWMPCSSGAHFSVTITHGNASSSPSNPASPGRG